MLSLLLAQTSDLSTELSTDAAVTAADAAAATAAVGLGIGMLVFWLIFGVGGFILFLWALIDVIKRQFPNPNDKILWIVLIIFLGWIGPILYLAIGRKKGNVTTTA